MASFAEKEFAIALSPALLEDLLRVLEKPKLRKLISPDIFEDMISLIYMKALIVKPRVKVKACRDPEDDAVIECAIAAKAKRIVTGDQDLLTMKTYRGISIIRPAPSHQAWAFPDSTSSRSGIHFSEFPFEKVEHFEKYWFEENFQFETVELAK